jgi:O-succinylhomoserine sulfhydrylase
MAAINAVFMAHLKPGDHIVSSRSLFGTTQVLYDKYLSKFGIEVSLVDIAEPAQWRDALRPQTKFLFVETPSNPLAEVADIQALAEIAHSVGAKLIVDNCFCTPALQRPLEFGADIIIHSATKYLDGQGRCLGGAALGRCEDMAEVYGYLRTTGATLSAFNAWVFLKGIETLTLRMKAHSANAMALATWLQQQPGVQQVHYAGLTDSRYHDLAARQQSAFGGVLSFTVVDSRGQGDRQAAWRFIDATELVSITANLGDVKSTITHPGSTTHGRLAEQEKQRTGIDENLIRIAVGLEGIEDIKADMRRGLAALGFSQ